MKKSAYRLKTEHIAIATGILALVLNYFFFIYIQEQNAEMSAKSIFLLVRSESVSQNPNQLTRAAIDLERIGSLTCSSINQIGSSGFEFYKSIDKTNCTPNIFLLSGVRHKESFKGLSGNQYEFAYTTINSRSFYLSFLLLNICIALSTFFVFFFLRNIEIKKQEIFDLEKQHLQNVVQISEQVAHDIRSPLSALLALKVAATSLSNDKLNLLGMAIDRINNVADLLDARKRQLTCAVDKPETIANIIGQIVREKEVQVKSKDISLLTQLPTDTLPTQTTMSSAELKRVLSNILSNSIEAKGEDKLQICISLERQPSKVVKIVIADNGVGIPPKILNSVFKRGFSTKDAQKGSAGAGLGLHHAKMEVEKSGGSIETMPGEPSGTIVGIYLPTK